MGLKRWLWRIVPAGIVIGVVSGLAACGTWPISRTLPEPDGDGLSTGMAIDDPRRAFAAGLRLAERGRLDDAGEMFLAAAARLADPDDRAAALHDAGVALARRGRDREALDAWRAALRLGDRESTRRNYEIVAARLRRASPPRLSTSGIRADRLTEQARALERPRRRSAGASRPDW